MRGRSVYKRADRMSQPYCSSLLMFWRVERWGLPAPASVTQMVRILSEPGGGITPEKEKAVGFGEGGKGRGESPSPIYPPKMVEGYVVVYVS